MSAAPIVQNRHMTSGVAMRSEIGQYEIMDELGRGGMGVVYKARDPALDRYVAIKCLAESLSTDETVVARFIREARSVAKLNHPGIVQVYAADQEQGQPFFVMELVDGESLEQKLAREARLSNAEAVRIWMEAGSALHAAHEAGITHRDIKPSNILLDRSGRVKLTDFGIALVEGMGGSKLTTTGSFVGTPGYFSPEVCQARPADRRSDIFSLGVVMYESLAGELPFNGDSPFEMMNQVVAARCPDIRSLNKTVEPAMREVLHRMLEREPDARYRSCADMIDDLRAAGYAGGEGSAELDTKRKTVIAPVTAQPPPGATPRTVAGGTAAGPITQRRRGLRRRGAFVAVALIVFAAAGGAFYIAREEPDSGQPPSQVQVNDPDPSPEPSRATTQAGQGQAEFTSPDPGRHNSETVASADSGSASASDDGASAVALLRELRGPVDDTGGAGDGAVAESEPAPDATQGGGDASIEVASVHPQNSAAGDSSQPAADSVESPASGGASASSPKPESGGIVVMAIGSPLLAGPVESRIEAALHRDGHELVEEQFISGIQNQVQGDSVDLAGLSQRLRSAGAGVLVLARVIPVGERLLRYSGRTKTAYTSRVSVKSYDLVDRAAIGGGWQNQVTFTDINVTDKARQSVDGHLDQLRTALAAR